MPTPAYSNLNNNNNNNNNPICKEPECQKTSVALTGSTGHVTNKND